MLSLSFSLFLSLFLSLALSLPLSLASCQPLIVFWCSCRLVMVLYPFKPKHSRELSIHADTHTQLSLQICIKPAVLPSPRRHAMCARSFAYIHMCRTKHAHAYALCLHYHLSNWSLSFLNLWSYSLTYPQSHTQTSTEARTVSQRWCQMQWCQTKCLHVKDVRVFTDSPAPLAPDPISHCCGSKYLHAIMNCWGLPATQKPLLH